MIYPKDQITAVILAGGKGRRLGGTDKGLLSFNGKAFVSHIHDLLSPQVSEILINANRHIECYKEYAQVISDELSGFQGPLAGMHTAMQYVQTPWILTVPCDGIAIRPDYVQRLYQSTQQSGRLVAIAFDGTRQQPVHALIHCSLAENLEAFLQSEQRGISRWYAQLDTVSTDFSDHPEMFKNINTPEDQIIMGAQ